jgi:cellulose synthase/poly-beta-1,6-N-acetylglucosamine synthase-like glycosyltransferase
MDPMVSIIIPVRNDAELLKNCLKSIAEIDYPKERLEVIIADGMSTDESAEVARAFGATVVENRKQTVSPGRNVAFEHSRGDIIAFTDADCIVDKNWIRNSIKYFDGTNNVVACVGGPNLTPPDENDFGRAVGFVFNQGLFAAGSIYARVLNTILEVKSIPGCNAVYRREALQKVMPIDESLLTCDDTELNQRILDNGYKLLYTPDVFVWHYRRPNPKGLFKQMYRYAIGRLQVGKRNHRMINPTHILVGLSLPLGILLFLLSPTIFLFLLSLYFLIIVFYSLKAFRESRSIGVALRVAVVITIILVGWSIGFVRETIYPYKEASGK